MTKLLEEAILHRRGYANAQLKSRPISEQDSIAALILEELQDNDDLGFSGDRFRKSWKQAVARNTLPLSQLWEDSEVD
jgi:hypothetical protein